MKLNFTFLFICLSFLFHNQAYAACNGLTYCASSGGTVDEWIENFEMGSISNLSGDNGGYMDFTPTFTTDITLGQIVTFTCTPGYDGTMFNEVFRIWIDFNADGDFDDAGELIFESDPVNTAVSGSFSVPINATTGVTGMRVTMRFNSPEEPCTETFTFGEVEDYCVNILEGNGCYQTPLTIGSITDMGAIASWLEVDDAESYNLRYREVGTTPWMEVNVMGSTSVAIDLQGCTIYEAQIETLCPNGLSSEYGALVEFLTFGCGNCLDLTYCEVGDPSSNFSFIESVELNTLNNVSGDDGGYGDFTGPVVASLEQGITYDMTVTEGSNIDNFDRWYTAYIDFNADGDFDDPFEMVMNSEEANLDAFYNQGFPVPPTAVVGTTRLRVIIQNFAGAPTNPCPAFLTGEIEDYCVEITEGSGCYLPLETAVVLNLGESIVIGWEVGLSAESFSIQYREMGSPTWIEINDIPGDASTYELTGLDECTDYEFQIKTNCVGISSVYSNTYSVRTFGCGACFDFTYCESIATSSNDDHIEAVSIGSLNNVSGNNGGYINFEDQFELILNQDSTYDLELTPMWPGFMFSVSWRVWIDFNADGDFDELDELVFEAPASTNVQTSTVTIPSDAAFGLTKMRVQMKEGLPVESCAGFTFGEVEDYCVRIQPLVLPCLFPENLDVDMVTQTSAQLIWELDFYETAIGYIIRYKAVDETEWSDELSTNDPEFLAVELDFCRDYEYQVRAVCPQDFSEYTESFVFSTSCISSTDDIDNKNVSALNIYPNPFSDRVQLDFELKQSADVTVELLNVSGKLIQIQQLDNLGSGTHQTAIVQTDLSAGMYIIRLSTADEVMMRKVIKN